MNLNLVGISSNISRAYEIAIFGGHSVGVIPSDDGNVTDADCKLISNFYGLETDILNPEIIVEFQYSIESLMSVLLGKKFETLSEITKRVKETAKLQVSDKLDKASMSLLKTATERLLLGISDVLQIISVSKTIANLANSSTIRIEHLAEAIQYKSIKPLKKP